MTPRRLVPVALALAATLAGCSSWNPLVAVGIMKETAHKPTPLGAITATVLPSSTRRCCPVAVVTTCSSEVAAACSARFAVACWSAATVTACRAGVYPRRRATTVCVPVGTCAMR